jgi:phosphatidylglycerophosphatase C
MNIYDFDDTIYDGDSSIDFFKYCIAINKKTLLIIPKFTYTILLYKLGIKNKETLKSVYFSFLKYFDNTDKIVNSFWNKNKCKIKDFYLKNHKNTDIIISASPEFLLKPIAKEFDFKLIASEVDPQTGKFISKNCHGQEKVNRLNDIGVYKCENFYSDSKSDEPLAKIANKAFLIKNDKIEKWY